MVMAMAAVAIGGSINGYHDSNNDDVALKTNLTKPTTLPGSRNT